MKTKKRLIGMISVVALSLVFQFSTVFASGIYVKDRYLEPDVNVDKTISDEDLVKVREVLVGKAPESADVNCDNEENVKDLVALKVFLETNYGIDNDFSVDDL